MKNIYASFRQTATKADAVTKLEIYYQAGFVTCIQNICYIHACIPKCQLLKADKLLKTSTEELTKSKHSDILLMVSCN